MPANSALHTPPSALALLEVSNLTPSLLVADRCLKSAAVRLVGIESTDSPAQCIKLLGPADAVRHAGEAGVALARQMGATASLVVMAGPRQETVDLANALPVYSPLLDLYDSRVPRKEPMNRSDAIGLLETQGLVASLHAVDEMLKSAAVTLVGKEKIGAAYVTVVIRGDVAAVQASIAAGKQTVERLGGKLILADVIPRPHPDLAALLPK